VLELALERLAGVADLTVRDKTYLWTKACDELDLQLSDGANGKKIKRSIVRVLLASGLVGRDKESIRRNLNRQWSAYCSNNRKLIDRRTTRDQRKRLSDERRKKLIGRSLDCGGRESQAVRELRESGELSADTITNPRNKSYVPASIRREITTEASGSLSSADLMSRKITRGFRPARSCSLMT
jgi:hypothetical protein